MLEKFCNKFNFPYCLVICRCTTGRQIIDDLKVSCISIQSKFLGEQLLEMFLEMVNGLELVESEELLSNEEETKEASEESTSSSSRLESSAYEPSTKCAKHAVVPIITKIKAVNLAKEYPVWKLSALQSQVTPHLKRKSMLAIWSKQIQEGGMNRDKYLLIDNCVHDRFVEARQRNETVTATNLQEWALQAAMQHITENFRFSGSLTRVKAFKRYLHIG